MDEHISSSPDETFRKKRVREILHLAARHLKKNEYGKAALLLQDARHMEPDNPELLSTLGMCLFRSDAKQAALSVYEHLVKLDPHNFQARYELGYMYVETRNYLEAEKVLRELLADCPEFSQARSELGFLYLRTGRISSALEIFEQGLEIAPRDVRLLFSAGKALKESGRLKEAERAFLKVLKLVRHPEDIEIRRAAIDALNELEFPEGTGLKEEFYLREGAILLGTSSDDGINIFPYYRYELSPEDILTTSYRFFTVMDALGLEPEHILPSSEASFELAVFFSKILGIPHAECTSSEPPVPSEKKIILIVALDSIELSRKLQKIPRGPDSFITFALVTFEKEPGDSLTYIPDFSGIFIPGPHSALSPSREQIKINIAAGQLTELFHNMSPDGNTAGQTAYYTCHHRKKLRPHLKSAKVRKISPELEFNTSSTELLSLLDSDSILSAEKAALLLEKHLYSHETLPPEVSFEKLSSFFLKWPGLQKKLGKILAFCHPCETFFFLEKYFKKENNEKRKEIFWNALMETGLSKIKNLLWQLACSQAESEHFLLASGGGYSALFFLQNEDIFENTVRKFLAGSPRVKKATLGLLRRLKDRRFEKEVFELLEDSDLSVRVSAVNTLRALSGNHLSGSKELQTIIHSGDEASIIAALDAVPSMERAPSYPDREFEKIYELALSLVSSSSPGLRRAAITAMFKIDSARACEDACHLIMAASSEEELLLLVDGIAGSGKPEIGLFLSSLAAARGVPAALTSVLLNATARIDDGCLKSCVFQNLPRVEYPHPGLLDYIEKHASPADHKYIVSLLDLDAAVRVRIASILIKLGLEHYLEILRDGLSSPDPACSIAAMHALPGIAGREEFFILAGRITQTRLLPEIITTLHALSEQRNFTSLLDELRHTERKTYDRLRESLEKHVLDRAQDFQYCSDCEPCANTVRLLDGPRSQYYALSLLIDHFRYDRTLLEKKLLEKRGLILSKLAYLDFLQERSRKIPDHLKEHLLSEGNIALDFKIETITEVEKTQKLYQ